MDEAICADDLQQDDVAWWSGARQEAPLRSCGSCCSILLLHRYVASCARPDDHLVCCNEYNVALLAGTANWPALRASFAVQRAIRMLWSQAASYPIPSAWSASDTFSGALFGSLSFARLLGLISCLVHSSKSHVYCKQLSDGPYKVIPVLFFLWRGLASL